MLAFLILSDDWDINRLGGGDDLSFVFHFMKVCAQAGKPPAEIVVDQSEVRQDHYLRVTLRYQGGN